MEQIQMTKKEVRGDVRRAGIGLLLHSALAIVLQVVLSLVIPFILPAAIAEKYNCVMAASGISQIILALCGACFFFLFFGREQTCKTLFKSNKPMTLRRGLQLLCLSMPVVLLGTLFSNLAEAGLNILGFTGNQISPVVHGQTDSVTMVIYGCLVAPIVEELIWRGFLMKTFEKYGKTTAVVLTGLLFGLMHGNIPQAISISFLGILWGYAATTYSLKWSMAMHILHNSFVFLLQLAASSGNVFVLVLFAGCVAALIGGVAILVRKRKAIKRWLHENASPVCLVKWIVSSVWLCLPVACYLFVILRSVAKL